MIYYRAPSGIFYGGYEGPAIVGSPEFPYPADALECPPPEHGEQIFSAGAWSDPPGWADTIAGREIDGEFVSQRIARLLFELEFDQESRLRVLEAQPAITRAQYRAALLARLKAL